MQATDSLGALRATAAALLARALQTSLSLCEPLEIGVDGPYCYVDIAGIAGIPEPVLEEVERAYRQILKAPPAVTTHEMLPNNAAELFEYTSSPAKAAYAEGLDKDLMSLARVEDAYYLSPFQELPELDERVFFHMLDPAPVSWEIGGEIVRCLRVRAVLGRTKGEVKRAATAWVRGQDRRHQLRGSKLGVLSAQPEGAGMVLTALGERMRSIFERSWWDLHPLHEYCPVQCLGLTRDHRFRHAELFGRMSESAQLQTQRFATVAANQIVRRHHEVEGVRVPSLFTRDLVSIFCAREQVQLELTSSLQFIQKTINILGLTAQFHLSKDLERGARWHQAEQTLAELVSEAGLDCESSASEVDACGPRLTCHCIDSLGRAWPGPFIEIDVSLAHAFGLRRKCQDGRIQEPSVLIRSLFSSVESVMGRMMELGDGPWPIRWAPEQVHVFAINSDTVAYAEETAEKLRASGIRAISISPGGAPFKEALYAASEQWVPYAIILGAQECTQKQISYRPYGKATKHGVELDDFIQRLEMHISGDDQSE